MIKKLKKTALPIILAGILSPALSITGTTTGHHQGKRIYQTYCAGCHGNDGEGFLRVYPPITGSLLLTRDVNRLPCIIRFGLKGELVVNGESFNGIMPGNEKLSTEEITTLVSYLLTRWGDATTDLHIKQWLDKCLQKQEGAFSDDSLSNTIGTIGTLPDIQHSHTGR
ncbi:c-type cytochrome [Desulfogranum japonicum]|uniref:c-type cytochrome n=1 Tax=Desulfogranum japonicum TaxID=231447 RepID=UPI00041F6368|nr:cytochrome c [Desulfogranum japonicum]